MILTQNNLLALLDPNPHFCLSKLSGKEHS